MKMQFALVALAVTLPAWAADGTTPATPVAPTPPLVQVQVMGFTNITISGLLAVGAKESDITNTTRPGMKNEYYLCDNTSRLIVSSSSKITDGWAVIGRIESRFEVNNGPGTALLPNDNAFGTYTTGATYGGWAEGDTWGGVASPYGSITFGKSTLYYTDTISIDALGLPAPGESYRIWDANGLATFNLLSAVPIFNKGVNLGSGFTLGCTRSQNVIQYKSPKFGAFDFSLAISKNPYDSELQYSTSTPISYENGGLVYGKFNYNDGPFSASLSLLNLRAQGGSAAGAGDSWAAIPSMANTQGYRAGASYTFPIGLKVGAVYDHTAVTGGIITTTGALQTASRGVIEVPVSYTFGAHAVYATYTKAGETTSIANSGATQYNLVYDYAMTKRAFIGLFYTSIRNQSAAAYSGFLSGTNLGPSALVQGENWSQIGLNLNYWF